MGVFTFRDAKKNQDQLVQEIHQNPDFYPKNRVCQVIWMFSVFLNILVTWGVSILILCSGKAPKKEDHISVALFLEATIVNVFLLYWSAFQEKNWWRYSDKVLFWYFFQKHSQFTRKISNFKLNLFVCLVMCCINTSAFAICKIWIPDAPLRLSLYLITISSSFIAYMLPKIANVAEHNPLENDIDLIEKTKFELWTQKEKWLSVRESDSFRIVIENQGNEVCYGYEVRKIVYDDSDTTSEIIIKPDVPIKPGDSVVIIPETHYEPGAYKAKGYRSFGPWKCPAVYTVVIVSDSSYSAGLFQEFEHESSPDKKHPFLTENSPDRFVEDRLDPERH